MYLSTIVNSVIIVIYIAVLQYMNYKIGQEVPNWFSAVLRGLQRGSLVYFLISFLIVLLTFIFGEGSQPLTAFGMPFDGLLAAMFALITFLIWRYSLRIRVVQLLPKVTKPLGEEYDNTWLH